MNDKLIKFPSSYVPTSEQALQQYNEALQQYNECIALERRQLIQKFEETIALIESRDHNHRDLTNFKLALDKLKKRYEWR